MAVRAIVILSILASFAYGRIWIPCNELHRDLRYPCRCHVTGAEEILMDCDRVVFPGDFPALPFRAPIVSFSQKWAGHHSLQTHAFTSSEIPLRVLDYSGNSLRRLTDRLLHGLHETLQELLLADNLLGDNLNPIFSTNEFHGLSNLRVLELSGNLIKAIEEGILKGCENLQDLRLARNSLTSVPSSSLNGPRALRILSLKHNSIDVVKSGAFLSQISLERIDLSYNLLDTIEGGAFSDLSHLRRLHIGHNKFVRFNSDVFEGADNLEYLDLSENFLAEIPSVALKVFAGLKYLNLSSNLIQGLESTNLASQSELEVLDLSRNSITNIAPGTFLGLRKLRKLDISVNALRTVEDDAFEGLENLESLSLLDNNILLIPASALGRLPQISILHMDYNRVAALSGDILRSIAERITSLSLSRNVVRELPPASFEEFKHLERLDLSGNLLASMTATSFIGLENTLKELRLSQNKLTTITNEPLSLPLLDILDLSRNALVEISRNAFTEVPSLKYLNISQNPHLVSLHPSVFQKLRHLKVLDLSYTGLKLLSPDLLENCQALRYVSLKGNMIQELTEGTFHNLRNLTEIDLSNNNILNIRLAAFSGLSNIKRVFLNGNRLSAFKGEYFRFSKVDGISGTTLEELNLANNDLSYLFPSSFRVHPRLRRLIVGDNKFSFFPAELITALQFLEHVDLSGNSLKSVEELDFARLPRLRTLLLARNQIESLSESAFHNSTQLQILNLANNKLERLGERTFEGLARLEMLDLSNNLLSELPDSIFERSRLQMLENINLSGNKFEIAPLKTLQRQYFFLSSVDLSRNMLKNIPPEDSMMVNIKRLDLSFNPLSEEAVKNVLGEPKTVRELNLASTGITKVTELETPFLRHLNLSHNNITDFSEKVFERPTLLEVLDISKNKISDMKGSLSKVWTHLKSLKYLDFSRNSIQEILQGDFDGLESLETLKMYDLQECMRIEKNSFRSLNSLLKLEAYGYPRLGYLDVHGIIQSLPSLEVLDIEVKDASVSSDQLAPALHPRLREFSVRGSRVHSLSSSTLAGLKGQSVIVGLRNTSLNSLPPALFFTLPRSTRITLDVVGSQLSTLTPQLLSAIDERRGDLKLVGLSSNPIVCDCGARALRRWLPSAGMPDIRCSAPSDLAGSLLVEIADDALTCDPNKPSTSTSTTSAGTSSTSAATSTKTTTEPDIIWSMPPANKEKANIKTANGSSNKGAPNGSASSLNNDDTLIIGIVGGVVAFIAILIIIICIVRLRLTNNQYRGGPLATPGALSIGHPPSMMAMGNGCNCTKPPPPVYMTPAYAPTYATLPSKMIPPSSISPGLRPAYSTMGRQPYYQTTPYFIPYSSEEKEHR